MSTKLLGVNIWSSEGRCELRLQIWKLSHLDEMQGHAVEEGTLGEGPSSDDSKARAGTTSKSRKKIYIKTVFFQKETLHQI